MPNRGREIPKVDTRELIFRNMSRFIQTGKYIPVDIVAGYVQRAELLLERTNGGEPTVLAELARYELLESGFVQPMSFNESEANKDEGRDLIGSTNSVQPDTQAQTRSHRSRRRNRSQHRRRRSRSQPSDVKRWQQNIYSIHSWRFCFLFFCLFHCFCFFITRDFWLVLCVLQSD